MPRGGGVDLGMGQKILIFFYLEMAYFCGFYKVLNLKFIFFIAKSYRNAHAMHDD